MMCGIVHCKTPPNKSQRLLQDCQGRPSYLQLLDGNAVMPGDLREGLARLCHTEEVGAPPCLHVGAHKRVVQVGFCQTSSDTEARRTLKSQSTGPRMAACRPCLALSVPLFWVHSVWGCLTLTTCHNASAPASADVEARHRTLCRCNRGRASKGSHGREAGSRSNMLASFRQVRTRLVLSVLGRPECSSLLSSPS